jgi:hypothetical protein
MNGSESLVLSLNFENQPPILLKYYIMLRLLIIPILFMIHTSVYDFKVPALSGGTIDLSAYKGKKS